MVSLSLCRKNGDVHTASSKWFYLKGKYRLYITSYESREFLQIVWLTDAFCYFIFYRFKYWARVVSTNMAHSGFTLCFGPGAYNLKIKGWRQEVGSQVLIIECDSVWSEINEEGPSRDGGSTREALGMRMIGGKQRGGQEEVMGRAEVAAGSVHWWWDVWRSLIGESFIG